jgi:L-ribulokinase
VSGYALGLDLGTGSCRALIVDLADGTELADGVHAYRRGVIGDAGDAQLARQHPADHLEAIERATAAALARARAASRAFDPTRVRGIGVATTGSTPLPVDRDGTPLAFASAFAGDPNALAWLWKDHTAHAEATALTAAARELRPQYLVRCGGAYSSEWFWAKAWRCRRAAPAVFAAAESWVELCDWLPGVLCGDARPGSLRRSACAAGHKALYHRGWGGLPDEAFLRGLDPALAELRARLYQRVHGSEERAGGLCAEWAARLGLPQGTPVAVGAFDAHMGAVGAGVRPGRLVKIIGTSTCDVLVAPAGAAVPEIPGICGVADGSVLPGHEGIEAGQSAVGDILMWYVTGHAPARLGATVDERFAALERAAAALPPGGRGLLALDWHNGNRSVLVDPQLSGLLVGCTLDTTPEQIYRALVEATAFGARRIVEQIETGVGRIDDVVACGGLAAKSPLLLQIYADVLGRPIGLARSEQTSALGAALFGAVAAGCFADVPAAQAALCGQPCATFAPDPDRQRRYGALYRLYRDLHDAFGTRAWHGNLAHVMKELRAS